MHCVKCGKKTENEQIFCPHCLEVMEAYPVKPDAHIQLPTRSAAPAQKKSGRKRRTLNADEKIAYLRGKVRQQRALMIVLALALLATVGTLLWTVSKQEESNIGKNYTYVESTK